MARGRGGSVPGLQDASNHPSGVFKEYSGKQAHTHTQWEREIEKKVKPTVLKGTHLPVYINHMRERSKSVVHTAARVIFPGRYQVTVHL